jgi:YggT family protein
MSPALIQFLVSFVAIFLKLLYWAVFVRVLMSWFASSKTPFGEIVDQITEPILKPFRWARIGLFDLSPILALIVLGYIGDGAQHFLLKLL